jgi:hypothetical protein
MTLKTLADVRKLIGHLPGEYRNRSTCHRVEVLLKAAATGGADPVDVFVDLGTVSLPRPATPSIGAV